MGRRAFPLVAAGMAAVALALTACGSADEEPSSSQAATADAATASSEQAEASGAPIEVGGLASLTGPFPFPDATKAAAAVFEEVNAAGGVNGHPIEYHVEDDKGDPAVATQAARSLIQQQDVVGLVSGASLLECAVNAPFYQQSGTRDVTGIGTSPQCFSTPNIAPVNTGPFAGITVSMYYASEELGHDKVCVIGNQPDGWNDALTAAVDRWSQLSGLEPAMVDFGLNATDDLTPFLLRAVKAGCQALVLEDVDFQTIAAVKAVDTQGIEGMDLLPLTTSYSEQVAEALANSKAINSGAIRLFANSEFEPFTGDSPANEEWRALMEKHDIPLTSTAQGDYIAAKAFIAALETIEGEPTREAVGEALENLTSFETPMMGVPYAFGPGDAHNPNQASKFVQLKDGAWEVVTPDWIVLPQD
ncbi:MAG TPA: ABC transporter substrate-binding protein [Capillimicrobium sp.]|nr:ABC transporter substrate-binding protein [Capillimicrobium sp.]